MEPLCYNSSDGSTETNSPESSDFDDLNDQTCPFCENDLFCEDHDLLYCSKGSLCSRRSKATLKSRKVPGKRKKLPLPPKKSQQQRHLTTAATAFIHEAPSQVVPDVHRVVRQGYCFLCHLFC